MITRRGLLGASAASLALGLTGRRALSATGDGERKFLFVLADGGWDTTYVFTPEFDNPNVDMEADAGVSEAGGIRFVDHEDRPEVRAFFETWGPQACVINGMEVRSVTHERCKRMLMTGTSDNADDWPSIIAASSAGDLLLPYLVIYGMAYNRDHVSRVVRVGTHGQLPDLLDGSALLRSGYSPLPDDADALADELVRARTAAFREAAGVGRTRRFGDRYGEALDALEHLRDSAGELSLDPPGAGCSRHPALDAAAAFDCFQRGLSRCAMVQYDGWCSERWDTHSDNHKQAEHFSLLFGYLDEILADLATRTSSSGGRLADEVTVVVLSEMGRHPRLNASGGRDHWTYTSAMLLGAGVRGGQVIGRMDDAFQGEPVDPATGEVTSGGTGLLPKHLGATLLAMADIDPAEHVGEGYEPITAAMT